MIEQLALLPDAADPPTGPLADPHPAASGTYSAYLEWLVTEDGIRAFIWVETMALEQLAAGAARISPRTLVARARDRFKIGINDHYTPWIADDLVTRQPALLELVERRKRKKAKV